MSSLAVTLWVLTNLCCVVGLQGVIRVRPVVFIRPPKTKIWLCGGRLCTALVHEGKVSPFQSQPHNSICFRFFLESRCSSERLLGVGRGVVPVTLGRMWGSVSHPRATQLSLSWILPRTWQGGATRSGEGGAAGSLESEASRPPLGGGLQKSWGNGPYLKTTQLSH